MPELPKLQHEIRDPVHNFIQVSSDERRLLDSRPLQRLRRIHQLALTELVYPGAAHTRFEHSLGTMHMATQVFDVVTQPLNVTDYIRQVIAEVSDQVTLGYWRSVLRAAALCHDLGHLPFSHAAEHRLLPDDWDHERLSKELILSPELAELWGSMVPPLNPDHVVKLAVGKRKAPELEFSLWEEILSEIIVGDAFGADRMDYLLRDSHHAGVAYGRFDHHRLVGTLRILPSAPRDREDEGGELPLALGVEQGGLHAAEALLLARYFMFAQVYLHPIRRVYDLHLIDFLSEWLDGGRFSVNLEDHLAMTDSEVLTAINDAGKNENAPGHDPARRIVRREHFKLLYQRTPEEGRRNPAVVEVITRAGEAEFGPGSVIGDEPEDTRKPPDFPVLTPDRLVVSSDALSDVLNHMPVIRLGYAFIRPDLVGKGREWLKANREELTSAPEAEENPEEEGERHE